MGQLLPERHKQTDFFVCDILDATPKDDIGSMEHPMFTLSKKPDRRIRRYEHNGEYIEIKPGFHGLANIFDKDILIFAISMLIAGMNEGREPSKTICLTAYDLLHTTNRPTDGDAYQRLKAAFNRLEGTRIETCLRTGGKEITRGFGLIDSWEIIRKDKKGRMEGIEMTLSDWLYNAILAKEVLTISPDYFRIGKPIERRIYELCRKHCGRQPKWEISLKLLHKKVGATAPLKKFRFLVKDIAASDHIPDYWIKLDGERDVLIARPRQAAADKTKRSGPRLKTKTYETAAQILGAHGLDKYAIEEEWREWITGKEPPHNPDGAYIGFCKMKIASL